MHMLRKPECIVDGPTFVLDQVPKRMGGELKGNVKALAEGWGLYFQEGWDLRILTGMVVIVLVASLIFAVLWSYFKHDVQGAFGVSSYIVTAIGVPVALFLNQAGRLR
jgi:hypothetical protein